MRILSTPLSARMRPAPSRPVARPPQPDQFGMSSKHRQLKLAPYLREPGGPSLADKLLLFPDIRLRQISQPNTLPPINSADPAAYYHALSPGLRETIHDLIGMMGLARSADGLAAPQMGSGDRVFVTRKPLPHRPTEGALQFEPGSYVVFINPKNLAGSKGEYGWEGCLSIPEYHCEVKRFAKINALETTVLELKETDDGFSCVAANNHSSWHCRDNKLYARLVAHELDHLDGVLILDKARNGKAHLRGKGGKEVGVADILNPA